MNSRRSAPPADSLYSRYSGWIAPILAILAMAVLLFSHDRPPLFADYPEWTYHGVLLRNVLQGHPDSTYVLKSYPVPNSLTTVGLAALMLVMPWATAAKLWLLVEVGLGLWCAGRLQRAAAGRQCWPLMVITAGALMGINLWYGFTNFQFATYFAMFFGALLIEEFQSSWAYGALLVLLFFSHMIPFGFAVCLLVLYARQTGRWRLVWQTIPSLLLCVWYFLGLVMHADVDAHAGMQSSVRYGSLAFIAFRVNTCLKCWGFVNPVTGFHDSVLLRLAGPKLFVFFFGLDVVLGVWVIVLGVSAARRSIAQKDSMAFLWWTAALFFVVGLVMPGAAAGISDPGARMIEVSLWCAGCVLGNRGIRTGLVLWGCAAALTALSFYEMARVAEKAPTGGTLESSLPMRLLEFNHVGYGVRADYYDKISQGEMDASIYPTAMFTERSKVPDDKHHPATVDLQ